MPDPVLRTERLVLRPLTATAAQGLLGREDVGGFPTGDDVSVLRGVAAAGADARGTWVVELDGAPVGTLGCVGPVTADGDLELSYGLVPAARGQGLATEAVGAVAAVLETDPGVRRLVAQVLPGNSPSMRVLHRLGFVPVEGGSEGHQLLARSAPGHPAVRPHLTGRHVC